MRTSLRLPWQAAAATLLAAAPLAAQSSALSSAPGDDTAPEVVPAPKVEATGATEAADPDALETIGTPITGERVEAKDIRKGRVESMDAVRARDAELQLPEGIDRLRNGRHGAWKTVSPKTKNFPHSGDRCVTNQWGDPSVGIGFGGDVDVSEAWIASQGGRGAWAEAVRVVGFRGDAEVAATDWLENVSETPQRLAISFDDVDRIVFEARPGATGAAFFSMDDLTFAGADGEVTVIDFEDAPWKTVLTGTRHGGLTWEVGTGQFLPPAPIPMPAPVTGGPLTPAPIPSLGGSGPLTSSSFLGGAGTAPTLIEEFGGPRFGNTGAQSVPPDTFGSVGPDHFGAMVNSNFSVYEKDTQNRVLNVSLQGFWGAGLGDPRIAYDPSEDRWVALATTFGTEIFLAYSLTNDPSGDWFKTSFVASAGSDAGRSVDFPTLGVDSRGIFIEAAMFGGQNVTMTIFAIDKAPLLAATPSLGTITAFRNLTFNGAIQHATQITDAGTSYMVSTRTGNSLRLRRINAPLSNPTLSTFTINGAQSFSNPPDAPAMGSAVDLDTGDTRLSSACYVNGLIWTSHCISSGGRAALRWYAIDPVTRQIVQQGTVTDPSLYLFFPSIAADAEGNVVMGCSGSNSTTFAGCYYTGRLASDPAGQMANVTLYADGLGAYQALDSFGRNRWGDYSQTTLDPVDGTFWTIQERARTAGNLWATRIAHLGYDTCGTVTRYCSAVPNPSGVAASIDLTGTPSVSANDINLFCFNLPGQTFGLFFYGQNDAFAPVGDGNLCITNPFFRLQPVQSSPLGIASYGLDLTTLPAGSQSILGGETWNFSFWYRQMGPAGYNFSDALSVNFCD